MSTLALDGSDRPRGELAEPRRGASLARHADLVVLVTAMVVFVLAGLPLLGYAAAAAGWLAQHAVFVAAERRSAAALRAGERTRAVGSIAVATFVRLWLITLPILLVGLLAEREDGLAAAVLSAALVTVHLGGRALSRAFAAEPQGQGMR